MSEEQNEEPKSCVEGLSRKEFIHKVLTKAALAASLATIAGSTICVHPSVAQVASETAV